MAITRRHEGSPWFGQVPTLRDEVNRLFDDFVGSSLVARDPAGASTWHPPVDVIETGDHVTITADLPGVQPDEVDINLTGNLLTLRGEKKEERQASSGSWHRVERHFGSFVRQVVLPETIDAERARASYANGVLTVEVAKSEASKPKTIRVNVK